MKVFKPGRIVGVILAFAGAPIAFLGAVWILYGIYSDRGWIDWDACIVDWGFFLIGSFIVMAGLAMTAFRIVIDREGMARSSWFGLITYRDTWDSLKTWTLGRVEDPEMPCRFYIEFEFDRRRWPIRIEYSLVVNPGFEAFLAEIRRYSGPKEKANPSVQCELTEYVNS